MYIRLVDFRSGDDAALERLFIYETNVTVAQGAGGELFNYLAIVHIGTDAEPAWFGPVVRDALNQALCTTN